MKIAFLGNFQVPFSTESHHASTWEKLGHQVVRLQESRATIDEVIAACRDAQVFQFTHTHGWGSPDVQALNGMITRIRSMGVKSFSYHLDYYFGLNAWDRRENKIGVHPSWKVDHFFSTDGAHEEEYRLRGINHHYLPPGVVEYGCFEGTKKPNYVADIGFAGSANYHPEYPFRQQMIMELSRHYGHRFKVFQGVRERALNDLYASVPVWVGDHVFAGCPQYWSDRLPETCGRGGFIIYPRTEGLTIPVITYNPQDVGDLIAKIDYYLTHEDEREEIRKRCHEHVKKRDTYTVRLVEVLRILGV